MKIPIFIGLLFTLLVSGCSVSPEKAKSLTSYELCKVTASRAYTDNAKGNALDEISSRGYDCTPVYRQVDAENAAVARSIQGQQQLNLQQQQIQNQNTNNLIQSIGNNNPVQVPITTHCNQGVGALGGVTCTTY
jgi:hypothetical protein